MDCRVGCGACCIAPSIHAAIPGMPNGKPAGVVCMQLDDNRRCKIYGSTDRPDVCGQFKPDRNICAGTHEEALGLITVLEQVTAP
jgi:Fe-S-cluster containining protein